MIIYPDIWFMDQNPKLAGGLEHLEPWNFMFPSSWDDDPIWLIFFRGVG